MRTEGILPWMPGRDLWLYRKYVCAGPSVLEGSSMLDIVAAKCMQDIHGNSSGLSKLLPGMEACGLWKGHGD